MKKRFLLSICAALIVPGILLSGCSSTSGAASEAVSEIETDDASAEEEESADTEDTASSRSGRSSLADKLARAAQETDEDDNENEDEDEEESASSVKEDEEDASERESADDDADDEENEWSLAEYTYYLGIKEEYDPVDSDDGDGILMNLLLQYLEIEPQYDEYGEELSAKGTSGVKKAIEEINGKITDDNEAFRSEYLEMAQEQYDSTPEDDDYYYFVGFSNEETLTISRADSLCLSVVRDHYQDLAGAHGYTETTAYTYSAKTGKRLAVTDFVEDSDRLAGLIAEVLLETHDPMEFNDVSEDSAEADLTAAIRKLMRGDEYYDGDNDLHYVTWYPVNGGMAFVFNQYDLGPYAAGQFTCTLMARDYPDLFRDQYLYGPEDSVEEISLYEGYEVDGEELLIGEFVNSEETVETVQVYYGDKELELEVWGYDVKAYVMTVPAGKFLYLDVTGDNDWHNLYAIELGSGKLKAREMWGLGLLTVPVDPNHVMLVTRSETTLSTFAIKRSYHLDAANGGELVPNENMFQVIKYDENGPVFTLKRDAELEILDDIRTGETHREKVKKGTTMEVIRTDNDSVTDCVTEDGRTIRFTVDTSDWPYRVDGKYDLEDLLEGTVFVG